MTDAEKRAWLDKMIERYQWRGDWDKYAACVRERWLIDHEWARKTDRSGIVAWPEEEA